MEAMSPLRGLAHHILNMHKFHMACISLTFRQRFQLLPLPVVVLPDCTVFDTTVLHAGAPSVRRDNGSNTAKKEH